jgi:hypothetical protein
MTFAQDLYSKQKVELDKRADLLKRIRTLGGDDDKAGRGATQYAAQALDETSRLVWQNTFLTLEVERLEDRRYDPVSRVLTTRCQRPR